MICAVDAVEAHPGLAWLRDLEDGRAWLAALPRLLQECAARWRLRLGEPFPVAFESLPVAARLPDGTGAVLKIKFPGRENEHEAAASRTGAARGRSASWPTTRSAARSCSSGARRGRRCPSSSTMRRST